MDNASLPDARTMFLHLDAELARCRRNQGKLAVVVCEIGGVPALRSRSGEAAITQLYKTVAAGLAGVCREYDQVARSGDQFVLTLAAFEESHLPEKKRQIETVVEAAGLEACGDRVLYALLGAAFFPRDGKDAEDLLAEADRRRFLAKQGQAADPGASLDLRSLGRSLRRSGAGPGSEGQ